jgi:ribosomal protein L14
VPLVSLRIIPRTVSPTDTVNTSVESLAKGVTMHMVVTAVEYAITRRTEVSFRRLDGGLLKFKPWACDCITALYEPLGAD